MSDAFEKLAHQLHLIQTSVEAANEMAAQILRTEEDLFEVHLAAVLAEKPPAEAMLAYELSRHLKKWINIRHGYIPTYREISCGLKALGWQRRRFSYGMRWMPPSCPKPAAPELHDHEQQQDQ